MNILKSRRNLIIAAIVVAVAVLLSYRFVPAFLQAQSDAARAADTGLTATREVSTIATYEVPDGSDTVRFTIGLDTEGRVISVRSTDVLKGDTESEHLAKFSEGLLLVISGKKLSELTAIDRVGTSSLTTTAFNSALPDLKAAL